ncbi:MAG: hypothetical protein IJP03_03875 [Christensenellaceae bacterium]|nr:hypothetical protein [Christensenellaceae bacterium]
MKNRKTGKLMAVLLLALWLLAGCAQSVTNIVETPPTANYVEKNVYTLSADADVEYLGFNSAGQLIGARSSVNGSNMVNVGYKTGKVWPVRLGQPAYDGVGLLFGGQYAVFASNEGGYRQYELMSFDGGKVTQLPAVKSRMSKYPPRQCGEDGPWSMVAGDGVSYTLYWGDPEGGAHNSRRLDEIVANPANLIRNVQVEDAFVTEGQLLAAQVSVTGKTYFLVYDLTAKKLLCGPVECKNAALQASGDLLYYIGTDGDLLCLDMQGAREMALAQDVTCFALSADGKKVAYAQSGAGTAKIYLYDLESKKEALLDIRPGVERLSLSPDGSKLFMETTGVSTLSRSEPESEYVVFEFEQ